MLPGEILFKYFVYLVRSAVRFFRQRETVKWKTVQAAVHYTRVSGGEVEATYSYQFEGGYFACNDDRDFFWANSAQDHVQQFPAGSSVILRVNPLNPAQVAFRDDDQDR